MLPGSPLSNALQCSCGLPAAPPVPVESPTSTRRLADTHFPARFASAPTTFRDLAFAYVKRKLPVEPRHPVRTCRPAPRTDFAAPCRCRSASSICFRSVRSCVIPRSARPLRWSSKPVPRKPASGPPPCGIPSNTQARRPAPSCQQTLCSVSRSSGCTSSSNVVPFTSASAARPKKRFCSTDQFRFPVHQIDLDRSKPRAFDRQPQLLSASPQHFHSACAFRDVLHHPCQPAGDSPLAVRRTTSHWQRSTARSRPEFLSCGTSSRILAAAPPLHRCPHVLRCITAPDRPDELPFWNVVSLHFCVRWQP